MCFHGESRRGDYDVVVVGSGIGGLSAAALLAKSGRRVLVVERHDRVGGYAHSFRRHGYLFDSSVHLVGGCADDSGEQGLIDRLLTTLGVRERCHFERIDPFYTAIFPDSRVRAPLGIDAFIAEHARSYPDQLAGLYRFFATCQAMRVETARAADLNSPFDIVKTPEHFPTLLTYRHATLSQVLDSHLSDTRLKALLGVCWPYIGLPPSQMSFLYWATMMLSYLSDGAFYCRGTFQELADALADAVTENGGEVLLKSPVRRVREQGGQVVGVVLENGHSIAAPIVVSNVDARRTVHEFVGATAFPQRYLRLLDRLTPSISAFVTYAAACVDLDPTQVSHETFYFTGWDHDQAFTDVTAGRPNWLTVTVPTLADPSLAASGEHLFILTTLIAHDVVASWRDAKSAYTERMLLQADAVIPGLRSRVQFAESGTPQTMERYTCNSDGAIYGWALTPDQVGPGRLAHETPVDGLYLTGHWCQPGGGIYGVVTSGVQTARSVLGLPTESALWRRLGR